MTLNFPNRFYGEPVLHPGSVFHRETNALAIKKAPLQGVTPETGLLAPLTQETPSFQRLA